MYSHAMMLPGNTVDMQLYKGVTLEVKDQFKGDSTQAKKIMGIIFSDARKWCHERWISYAPNLELASDGFVLNIDSQKIVANVLLRNGKTRQFVSTLSQGEFEELKASLGLL